jgi:hypothetical protein
MCKHAIPKEPYLTFASLAASYGLSKLKGCMCFQMRRGKDWKLAFEQSQAEKAELFLRFQDLTLRFQELYLRLEESERERNRLESDIKKLRAQAQAAGGSSMGDEPSSPPLESRKHGRAGFIPGEAWQRLTARDFNGHVCCGSE